MYHYQYNGYRYKHVYYSVWSLIIQIGLELGIKNQREIIHKLLQRDNTVLSSNIVFNLKLKTKEVESSTINVYDEDWLFIKRFKYEHRLKTCSDAMLKLIRVNLAITQELNRNGGD